MYSHKDEELLENNNSKESNSKFEKQIGDLEDALTRKEIMEARGYKNARRKNR